LVLIHVHFGDLQLVAILSGKLFQDWANHFARTAPFSPEVEENWFIGLEDVLFERGVSYVFNTGTHENSLFRLI
jgi:hypothetical protein